MKALKKKLHVRTQTIRQLTNSELAHAAGGITGTCTAMCSNTTACHCFPKTMYPTE
jgi:hypothetical protein